MTKLLTLISGFFSILALLVMAMIAAELFYNPAGFWHDPNTFAWFFNLSIIAAVAVIAWKARKWDL